MERRPKGLVVQRRAKVQGSSGDCCLLGQSCNALLKLLLLLHHVSQFCFFLFHHILERLNPAPLLHLLVFY